MPKRKSLAQPKVLVSQEPASFDALIERERGLKHSAVLTVAYYPRYRRQPIAPGSAA